jgi:ectoine hydroxylase-related dioxygenase (phytanoyl-CoA dioxygenase family)
VNKINAAIEQIKSEGYAVLPNILTHEECEHYKKLCESSYNKYDKFLKQSSSADAFHGKSTVKMIYNLHNKHEDFFPLFDHAASFPIVKNLLQEGSYQNSEAVILKLTSARSPLDKAPPQQLHIDAMIPGTEVPLVMQVIFALDAFENDNGATRVVPGSHKRRAFAENGVKYPEEKVLTAPKGSVIIYNGALWHGSSEKITAGDRWAIILTYARWFFKTSFDHSQNTPASLFKKMSDSQKELLGFRFQPPKDEFTRLSRRSEKFEEPHPYELPK